MLGAIFFSSSETAFTAIPQHKVSSLIKQRKKGAKALYQLKQTPEKILTSILIGSNISNIGAASVATVIAVKAAILLQQPQNTIVSISTIVVTILMLVFGEIIPKTFATHNAEKVSLRIAPFYLIFSKLLSPLVYILEKLTNVIKKNTKKTMTDEDLEAFINLSRKYGLLAEKEDIRIKKLLKLDELTAKHIMTPRTKIKAIKDTLTIQEAINKMLKTPYSRFPIYHRRIDDTDRITILKEILRFKAKYGKDTLLKDIQLDTCIRIPHKQDLNSILSLFQKTHKHLGVVIDTEDPKQKIIGVVSLEDILEEVFGEIQDEADKEINPIVTIPRGIICQSYVRLDEALSTLNIDFDDLDIDPKRESKPLNTFIINYYSSLPLPNEKIKIPLNTLPENKKRKHYITLKILNIKEDIIGEVEIKKR